MGKSKGDTGAGKYRVRRPSFRLKGGSCPGFFDGSRLVQLGRRGVELWNVESGKLERTIARVRSAHALACSPGLRWAVTKNCDGGLAIVDFDQNGTHREIQRPPYQDVSDVAAWIDDMHFIDVSSAGDIHVREAGSGTQVAHECLGEAWMSMGVQVCPVTRRVLAGFNRRSDGMVVSRFRRRRSRLVLLGWPLSLADSVEFAFEQPLAGFSISPCGDRLVVALEQGDALLIRVLDLDGRSQGEVALPGQSLFFTAPVWSPDGQEITLIIDRFHLIVLDAATLAVREHAYGPNLTGFAYAPDCDRIAITADDGGIILPRSELSIWSIHEGKPKADLVQARYHAYERRIELRRAGPARAAVFRTATGFVVEAERRVAAFRYLPQSVPIHLDADCSAEQLGASIQTAIARFQCSDATADPILGPAFPGEFERMADAGVEPQEFARLRYLGGENAFRPDIPAVLDYVSITRHEGMLELWPGIVLGDGRFAESHWPHVPLPNDVSDHQLGTAVMAGFEMRA